MWKPTPALEKIDRSFRLFTYSMLLFSHGSHFGQASLTLGKDTRKCNIPAAMASVHSFKQTRQYFCFTFLKPRPSPVTGSRQQLPVAPASGFSLNKMKKKKQ